MQQNANVKAKKLTKYSKIVLGFVIKYYIALKL